MRVIITKRFLLCMLLSAFTALVSAQQRTITGTVKDEKGEPVPFASFVVKGTKTGGQTASNGSFRVVVPGNTAVLVFSFVGYKTKEVPVGSANTLNVTLDSDNNALSEVVVTALGIKRERKSLGYAIQEVKGESLVEAREPNLANALSGKVSGLQVVRSSNGPAGSSKIVLRGNNSLTGSNQPLIVVDGVPVDNFTGATNNDFYNPSNDMGNGLSDINPEDIESMTVLKGGSAAALYGSRAGNGVILITTKSGRAQKGLGINVNSSFGVESIFMKPEMQDSFGQGENGTFNQRSRRSWGPKIEGQNVVNWDGRQVPLTSYDNLGNFMERGSWSNQSVSLQQQYKSTSVYTSFNHLDNSSIIPGAKLKRTNLTARAVSKFGENDRWTADTKIQYSRADAKNRPIGGNRNENPFYITYLFPRSLNITEFENAVDGNNNMYWYGDASTEINPYWNTKYNTNNDVRDRYIMSGSLKYQFTSWLSGEIRGGSDMYSTNNQDKLYGGSPIAANGRYSIGKNNYQETNYSALFTATKDNLFGKLGGTVTWGGNLMNQKFSLFNGSSGPLNARDFFYINNGINPPTVTEDFYEKKINSLYGSVGLNWDGYVFLDGTLRNDWTTALSPDNNSYFYPSVNLSVVFTDMLSKMGKSLPAWVSFGKIRASYAEVGNDMQPYQLYNTYTIGKDPLGNTTATKNGTLFDPNVKNELIKSYEFGAEMRFLNNRFAFDVAWYKTNSLNQLIDLPMDPLSGYNQRKINAGDVENRGFEAQVNASVLNNPRSLTWNVGLNYSTNKSKINRITDDVTQYPLGGFDNVRILAVAGSEYGDIYGTAFRRVTDESSPFFGELLLTENGLPVQNPDPVKLGNQQASGLLGVTNTVAYRGVSLSFLVDARFGGKIFSSTNVNMQRAGTAAVTVVNGAREDIIADGVVLNSSNEYVKNTTGVDPQLYWEAIGINNLGITEANLYDATNIRLRNIQLNYDLPTKWISKTPLQRARLGLSCNNVWMIKSNTHGIDPESVFATGTNAVGFENGSAPTTRSFLFNLTLGF